MKSQKNKIRVMIADDHAILRSGLRMLLAAQEDIQVVGEAEDGTQTLEAVRATKPNVLLLDMSMPDSAGAEIIGQVRKQSPKTRVLILTMHTEPEYLHSALGAGASGYVLKRALDSDLIAAIRVTYKGETFVDSRMNRFLVERSLSSPSDSPLGSRYDLLTNRERQVLKLAAAGFTNRQIASRILISEKSVETYRGRLLNKLQLRDRAEMVQFALRAGILFSDPKSL